jgi:acyl-coenzyme A synthetase/AMP-(fatty) acid ligase
LNSIEGVRDGVFVMPDDQSDGVTRLMALVVAPGVSRETILHALRQRIDAAFIPRPLHLVDALPRNETGKLPRVAVEGLIAQVGAKAG